MLRRLEPSTAKLGWAHDPAKSTDIKRSAFLHILRWIYKDRRLILRPYVIGEYQDDLTWTGKRLSAAATTK